MKKSTKWGKSFSAFEIFIVIFTPFHSFLASLYLCLKQFPINFQFLTFWNQTRSSTAKNKSGINTFHFITNEHWHLLLFIFVCIWIMRNRSNVFKQIHVRLNMYVIVFLSIWKTWVWWTSTLMTVLYFETTPKPSANKAFVFLLLCRIFYYISFLLILRTAFKCIFAFELHLAHLEVFLSVAFSINTWSFSRNILHKMSSARRKLNFFLLCRVD